MHAVRRDLVEAQAERMGLPLWPVELPWPCSNAVYEARMRALCDRAVASGITTFAFGDLYLEDIRGYREQHLEGTGLTPVFPVWRIPTDQLARTLIDAGVKAIVTCVDPAKLDGGLAGCDFDDAFLASLPAGVDPCGENGEFHTFAYAAAFFASPIFIEIGVRVERDGFVFADLVPV